MFFCEHTLLKCCLCHFQSSLRILFLLHCDSVLIWCASAKQQKKEVKSILQLLIPERNSRLRDARLRVDERKENNVSSCVWEFEEKTDQKLLTNWSLSQIFEILIKLFEFLFKVLKFQSNFWNFVKCIEILFKFLSKILKFWSCFWKILQVFEILIKLFEFLFKVLKSRLFFFNFVQNLSSPLTF